MLLPPSALKAEILERRDCLLLLERKGRARCVQKPSISLPLFGGGSSASIQAAARRIHMESLIVAAERTLPTSTYGKVIGPDSQWLCSKVHHCVYSKARLPGLLPADTWGHKDRKAETFLGDTGPLQQAPLITGPPKISHTFLRSNKCDASTQLSLPWPIIVHQLPCLSQFLLTFSRVPLIQPCHTASCVVICFSGGLN